MSKKKFDKGLVATVSLAHLMHDTYSSFLAPILPLLIEKLGMSLVMSAFLDIARKIPALLNPFFGLLAERSDARWFVILAPALTAISMSLLGVTSSYVLALVLLTIAGVSATLFHIPSPGMIKAAAGDKLGRGMSFYMVGGELARTIGPLFITGGVSLWGLEGTWRLMPFGIIASLILYYKLKDFQFTQNKFSEDQVSLSDLFTGPVVGSSSTTASLSQDDAESSNFLKAYREEENRFIPQINFSSASLKIFFTISTEESLLFICSNAFFTNSIFNLC
jgi:MFS family permease